MKLKKQISSISAVTGILIAAVMGIWLLSMVILTMVTAQEVYDTLLEESEEFSHYVGQCTRLDEYYEKSGFLYGKQEERTDEIEYNMLRAIHFNTEKNVSADRYYGYDGYGGYGPEDDHNRRKLIRDVDYPMETAVLFYDGEGNLLHSSDEEILYFRYYTEEEWIAGESTSGSHYGWIDVSKEPEEGIYDSILEDVKSNPVGMDYPTLKITGTWEGSKFQPAAFYYINRRIIENRDESDLDYASYSKRYFEVERSEQLQWNVLYDQSQKYAGEELETIYIKYADTWDVEETPFYYRGVKQDGLISLAKTFQLRTHTDGVVIYDTVAGSEGRKFELNELMLTEVRAYGDFENETKADYYMVTSIRSNPLACALKALGNIYLITCLAANFLVYVARDILKKKLIQPVSHVASVMEEGWNRLYLPKGTEGMWQEVCRLNEEVRSEIDCRRMKENEITRLQTALDYAKTAEENRRQMTSAIAHELKTPLAIIHGYAEGLKEHIAEEKRDEYVDVILSETERIDGMVLEMLDLSRLEAGRIKLSRDEFSLKKLTESVFEKLSMAARGKNLQIILEAAEEFVMIGDENRLGQVIENFATNAIKYTNPGGKVKVQIQQERKKIAFYIENECPPLSDEALSKVWDTFYRTDESRQGTGTGLGLAIAKNIVELHGGQCFVRNTKCGVEFGFRL